jgi:pyridoxal phosphate enzyme (YggS family)
METPRGDREEPGRVHPGAGPPGQTSVRTSVERVRAGIRAACARTGRPEQDVVLVAVTKTVAIPTIRLAAEAGIQDFGENYAGELAEKEAAVPGRWHFIGRLQRGNAARIAEHADVIHSAEPGRALALVAHRVAGRGEEVPCLLQVDFTGRRHGVAPEDVARAFREVETLAGIRPVGLMTLPPWTADPEEARSYFARLRDLRDSLRATWPEARELSMGMSGDYEVAVEEGATMVRVGTALFGERPAHHSAG